MLAAQLCAGLAAAVIVPALMALIANHDTGDQPSARLGRCGLGRPWSRS
ncbi:MAG: hypothetical protein SNJ73_05725 [Acetobacteraceae bacterium]